MILRAPVNRWVKGKILARPWIQAGEPSRENQTSERNIIGQEMKLRMPLVNSSLVPRAARTRPMEQRLRPPREKDQGQGAIAAVDLEVEDQIGADPDHDNGEHDEKDAGEHLGAQVFQGGEGCGLEPFQSPILAIAHHHVTDPPEGGKHHVHAQDSGEEPVDIADLYPLDNLFPGQSLTVFYQEERGKSVPRYSRWGKNH